MSEPTSGSTEPTFTDPAPERSGSTVDEAVANAEENTQVEGVHTPSGEAESGESRAERMTEVEGLPELADLVPAGLSADVLYADDPFGVQYWVVVWGSSA